MPISREEAVALAELLCVIRPTWQTRGVITKGLAPLAKHPAPLEVIVWAAVRAASDRDNLTPAIIPLNGSHWSLAERPPAPRLTPENECPRHVGEWAGNCRPCNAERIGQPDPDDGPLEHRDARQRARDAAQRARRGLAITDDDQDATDPVDDPGTPTTP